MNPGERLRTRKQNLPSYYFDLKPWALDHITSPASENLLALLEYMRHCFEQRNIHVFHCNLEHFKYCSSQCLTQDLEDGQGVIRRGGHTQPKIW